MNAYTVRYAHLEFAPQYKISDVVYTGDKIGCMGNTGKSTAYHLHIDVVEGLINKIIRLSEIGYDKKYTPNIKQLNYFIDKKLFAIKPFITSYFYDPRYKITQKKDHPAYDLVPINRKTTTDNFDIYWNRSKTGIVLATGYDKGYGNYILIGFES